MRIKEEYDGKGNKTSETYHNIDANIRYSWKCTYDDKGSRISKILYNSEGNEI